jgi:hypothetical protein
MKTIKIENITEKGWVRNGVTIERPAMMGHHADITPGVSIRIHGVMTNRVGGPQAYDLTFKVGDSAVYGGYNLTYTGRIVSVGAKTVTIENHGQKTRLSIASFSRLNDDYDAAKIAERNAAWMD